MIEVIARLLLTRGQVLFPGGEIHHGHDFHCASVTPEVTRTGQAALSSLVWPDQGVWPRDRKGSDPAPRELIGWKRERQRVLWRIYLRSSGGKQGCLLSPALFGIFSSLLLSYVFDSWRSVPPYSPDGKLFNVALLRTKTKVKTVLVRDLLFADDTAFARHFEAALQRLITKLASAFINFGLKISLEKTNVSAMSAMPLKYQRPHSRGSRRIHLPRFHHLHELGPWLRISRRIGKHTGGHVQIDQQSLRKHLPDWNYQKAYLPGMRSRYLGLQQWNLDHLHETGTPLELFPSTMPHNSNSEILSRARTPSMYSLLIQQHLRWLEEPPDRKL